MWQNIIAINNYSVENEHAKAREKVYLHKIAPFKSQLVNLSTDGQGSKDLAKGRSIIKSLWVQYHKILHEIVILHETESRVYNI